MKTVIATTNSGKYREIKDLLKPLGWKTLKLDKGYKQIPENANSFVANCLLKARAAARHCNAPAISDDSGLVVPALNGEPGIKSARYAGNNRGDEENNLKLINKIKKLKPRQRNAFYHCALVFVLNYNDPAPIVATGTLHGKIVSRPIGEYGFGYDSIFYLEKYKKTVAQLAPSLKNKISHRGAAIQQFVNELKKLEGPK